MKRLAMLLIMAPLLAVGMDGMDLWRQMAASIEEVTTSAPPSEYYTNGIVMRILFTNATPPLSDWSGNGQSIDWQSNNPTASGGVMTFNGTDQLVGSYATNMTDLGDNWTVMLWMKIDKWNADAQVIVGSYLPGLGWSIGMDQTTIYGRNTNAVMLMLGSVISNNQIRFTDSNTFRTGEWHHVAAVVTNFTKISIGATVYIDGVPHETYLWTGEPPQAGKYTDAGTFRVGGTVGYSLYAGGRVYDLAIFKTNLSLSAITNNMGTGP